MHPLIYFANSRSRRLLAYLESEFSMTALATEFVVAEAAGTAVGQVAADVGNGQTVVIADGTTVVLPSAVSMSGFSSYRLFTDRQLAPGSWARLDRDEHVFRWADDVVEVAVGLLAEGAGEASSARGSNDRYRDGWTLPLILCGIAAALPKVTAQYTCRLATGVPAKLWGALAEDVAKALRGTHRFVYNGRALEVTIREVLVEREGPVVWHVLPPPQRQGKVIVIDVGERTTDVALLLDGAVRSVTTRELGVGGVLDDVALALVAQGHHELSRTERRALLTALRSGEPLVVHDGGGRQDIVPLARAHFDRAAQTFARELRALAPVDQADHLWLVGGGAYFMGDTLRRLLPGIQVPQRDAELLTAQAYAARLGMEPVKKGKRR